MDVQVIYKISELADAINRTNSGWDVSCKLISGVLDVCIYKQYNHRPKIRLIKMYWIIDDISEAIGCVQLLEKILWRCKHERD